MTLRAGMKECQAGRAAPQAQVAEVVFTSLPMSLLTFRNYAGPQDAELQYEFWLKATEGLPRAWRSNITNVRYLIRHGKQHPQNRIYAERDGELVGYIGSHPPFEWYPGGWTLPFGFPWTYPVDAQLEKELYDRMFAATPNVYPGQRRNRYVQRFRESWPRHIQFMLDRGWKHKWRYPICGRAISESGSEPRVTPVLVTADHLSTVVELAAADPLAKDSPKDIDELRGRLDAGWLMWDSFWHVPNVGAFALEIRLPWAEVKFFCVRPDGEATRTVLEAMSGVAQRLGATELYFTLEDGETERMQTLAERGFAEVDAGIYLVCEF